MFKHNSQVSWIYFARWRIKETGFSSRYQETTEFQEINEKLSCLALYCIAINYLSKNTNN